MRKFVAAVLMTTMASLGAPIGLAAQAVGGAISGTVLDAGGRALVNQRVELVAQPSSQVVQTTVTGSRGTWTFTGVAPGEYNVRLVANNGQVSGIRVSLAPSGAVTNALIVAPSAVAMSATGLEIGLLLALLAGLGAGLITTIVVVATGS